MEKDHNIIRNKGEMTKLVNGHNGKWLKLENSKNKNGKLAKLEKWPNWDKDQNGKQKWEN